MGRRGVLMGSRTSAWAPGDCVALIPVLSAGGVGSFITGPVAPHSGGNDHFELRIEEWQRIAEAARRSSLRVGVTVYAPSVTPPAARRYIAESKELIARLAPDIVMCRFRPFADKPASGDLNDRWQAHFINSVFSESPTAIAWYACPVVYSLELSDSLISRPEVDRYWRCLGRGVTEDVRLCWTGNDIMTTEIDEKSIEYVESLFRRPVCLWSNFPANDGHGWTGAIRLRPPDWSEWLGGHEVIFNPMRQPRLSFVAIWRAVQRLAGEIDSVPSMRILSELHTTPDIWNVLRANEPALERGEVLPRHVFDRLSVALQNGDTLAEDVLSFYAEDPGTWTLK